MTRRRAIKVDRLADIPSDLPGKFWRAERRYWADGTSCLHIAAWGTQPQTGKPAPWWPLQYTQVPWVLSESFLEQLLNLVAAAEKEARLP